MDEYGNIELPINFNDSKALLVHEASLVMKRDDKILENLFSRIKLVKAECGLYHLLKLDGLEVGEYTLKLFMCAN